jgi:hypothetical protein
MAGHYSQGWRWSEDVNPADVWNIHISSWTLRRKIRSPELSLRDDLYPIVTYVRWCQFFRNRRKWGRRWHTVTLRQEDGSERERFPSPFSIRRQALEMHCSARGHWILSDMPSKASVLTTPRQELSNECLSAWTGCDPRRMALRSKSACLSLWTSISSAPFFNRDAFLSFPAIEWRAFCT